MKLGVVACLHGNLGNVRKFAARFRKENIDAVALVGDIGSDEKQKQSLVKIIKIFSNIKKKVFVMPGNHEQLRAYYSALKKFKKNKNIVDCTKNPKIDFCGQKFVFLPGSRLSSATGAGFRILTNRKYLKRFKLFVKSHKKHFSGRVKPTFLSDFTKYFSERAVLMAHSPIKFNTKNAIDVADYLEATKNFIIPKKLSNIHEKDLHIVSKDSIFSYEIYKDLLKAKLPIKRQIKNVGDDVLKKLLKKYKISKFICGDIHEAGGRANDWKGRQVKQNKFSKELFFNCAAGKDGRAGIVEFLNDEARYRMVRV